MSFFSSETKVRCVQKSYHSFSDNGINYKPSMTNVQICVRFLIQMFTCLLWGKMPPSLTKQFALNINSNIRVQAVLV